MTHDKGWPVYNYLVCHQETNGVGWAQTPPPPPNFLPFNNRKYIIFLIFYLSLFYNFY